MKAQIITKHHENTGGVFRVVEILHNRIVCLEIDEKKVDFGLSEVRFLPSADFGRDVLWQFTKYGEERHSQKDIDVISKRASILLFQRKKDVSIPLH